MIDRRAAGVVVGILVIAAIALWLLKPKVVSATPAPASSSSSASEDQLLAKVQQERKDELAQWQIVARNVTRLMQDGFGSAADQAMYRTQLATANDKIAGLEQEITAHGG